MMILEGRVFLMSEVPLCFHLRFDKESVSLSLSISFGWGGLAAADWYGSKNRTKP